MTSFTDRELEAFKCLLKAKSTYGIDQCRTGQDAKDTCCPGCGRFGRNQDRSEYCLFDLSLQGQNS